MRFEMKINDFESEILWRGKVLKGRQAEIFLIGYLMFWVLTAFTAGFAVGFFANN
jgi:hypothetical protein